ncbi:olfactory receptor 13H1-like [Hemicordylus capensis]|uniref:olfactory receptor 13H1-like n=1 Tax=Hemicordylus capensis TaxID=884348 RepID=UPI002302C83D|nr:olfactory receptor 13H1-like [Hemicordylus capensis]
MDNMNNRTFQFVLVGLSQYPQAQAGFFWFLLVIYMVTLIGNGLIVMLVVIDPALHTPMYFFLCNHSFIDICYSSCSIPQMMANSLVRRPVISFSRCLLQMYISLFLGMTEFLLLAMMAYDRFVAICSPLHYTLIISWQICVQLVATSWSTAFLLTLVHGSLVQNMEFCGHNVMNHFTCELQGFIKLACSDTRLNKIIRFVISFSVMVVPFTFILVTYGRIGLAILHIRSAQGWGKATSTCSSHLAVVGIFYGTAMAIYLRPQGKASSGHDKLIAIFYGAVTPMLNPLIYSLRNRDIRGALQRTVRIKVKA